MCCMPLSPIRCGGPSATRTRKAAKRAFSGPFAPLRQASVRHCAWAAASGDGKDEFDVPRVNLLMTKNAIRPGKPARAQGLTELSAHASMRRRQRPIATAT
jgi:hypothetical protein